MIDEPVSGHTGEVANTRGQQSSGEIVPEERVSETRSARPDATDATDATARLREIVDSNFDFVWRSLRRLGVPAADSDDGAQRVFVVASRRLAEIEPGRERAFLFGTAYLVAREIRRASSRRHEILRGDEEPEVVDPSPDPEERAHGKQARALLDEVLDALPIQARTVFVLFELEELSMPDIAALLEVPLGTAASRLRRARELFRAAAARVRARTEFRGGQS